MKYSIIGGQYNYITYGQTNSLHAAKCLATRNSEYWDNWQGWHSPAIYLTEELDENGYPTCGCTFMSINPWTHKWEWRK